MRDVLIQGPKAPNRRTVTHWATVLVLTISSLLILLTSIYFLILPSGGFQGGRNPHYGQTFLFDRHVWIDIHTWAGMVLIAVSVFHILLHRQWVAEMGRRALAVARRERKPFNRRVWARVAVATAMGLLFVGVAVSGVYFYVVPGGQGAGRTAQFLVSRSTWDLVHTWTGVFMLIVGALHLWMRRKWVARVTAGVTKALLDREERRLERSYV
jgi:Domain of unknown function (DUF4405)